MLKHVEQSVALAALKWFRANKAGLVAMYAPHAELDAQFRGRLAALQQHAAAFESTVAHEDPDTWPTEVVLGAFQASLMLKDALDAAGPRLLQRTHQVLGRAAIAAGLPILDPRAVATKGGPRGRRASDTPRQKRATKKARRRF